jgi:hypothetical protein
LVRECREQSLAGQTSLVPGGSNCRGCGRYGGGVDVEVLAGVGTKMESGALRRDLESLRQAPTQ